VKIKSFEILGGVRNAECGKVVFHFEERWPFSFTSKANNLDFPVVDTIKIF